MYHRTDFLISYNCNTLRAHKVSPKAPPCQPLLYIIHTVIFLDQPPVDYQVKNGASPGGRVISKFDLGRFLVESLTKPEHYGQIVGICNKHPE